MSRIITISREFGSGGRELGKRLADLLGVDYYDREMITAIAEQTGLGENYVEQILESHEWQKIPLNFRHSFADIDRLEPTQAGFLIEQKRVIEKIAKTGKDCVIVGRNADILLSDEKPFSVFVHAAMDARIRRCMERAEAGENMSPEEIEKNILRIDESRAKIREVFSGSKWGAVGTYHLMINTTDWNIKELTPAVAEFASRWFEKKQTP